MRILVAEDHPTLGPSIANGLRDAGFAADLCTDGQDALHQAKTTPYDGIILDVGLPHLSGFEILSQLRRARVNTPVLYLTARDGIEDRVRGLDLGADDYLPKPFAWKELLARLRAIVRRGHGKSDVTISIADMTINTAQRRVERDGKSIELTAREYALLEYLAHRTGEVVSRTELWEHLWEDHAEISSNVVDVYVGYLRNKIDKPFSSKLVHTRRGMGYVLAETPS